MGESVPGRYDIPGTQGGRSWVEAPQQSVYHGLPLAPGVSRADYEADMYRRLPPVQKAQQAAAAQQAMAQQAAAQQAAAVQQQQTQPPIQRTLPAQTVQQQRYPLADQTAPRAMGPARSIAELRVLQQQEAAREIAAQKEAEAEHIAKTEPVREELADAFVKLGVTDAGGNLLKQAMGTVPPPAVVDSLKKDYEQYVPAELKFQKELRDDEYRKSKAGIGVQGEASQKIRELSSPEVYAEVQRRVTEGTDSMKAKKESISNAKGALAKMVAEAAGFAPMQAMQPIAALFDTWGGRGKLQDIFKKIDNPYKDAAIETAKLIEKGESSLAKDEIAMMKELLGDATTRKLIYDVTVDRESGRGGDNLPGNNRYRQTPAEKAVSQQVLQDAKDLKAYGDLHKTTYGVSKNALYRTMTQLEPLISKYKSGQLPVGLNGIISPAYRAALIRLGYKESEIERDAVRIQQLNLRMLSDLTKMQSGSQAGEAEAARLKGVLGGQLTPEAYVQALEDMRELARSSDSAVIGGYSQGAQDSIYSSVDRQGNPRFITDESFGKIHFKSKAEEEASGGGAVAPPKDLKQKKNKLKGL